MLRTPDRASSRSERQLTRGFAGPVQSTSSADQFPERLGIGEIAQHGRGLMRGQRLGGMMAGGEGKGAGADDPAAGDVVRRVANDPDAIGLKQGPRMLGGAAQGVRPQLVAIRTVIGEGAEGE